MAALAAGQNETASRLAAQQQAHRLPVLPAHASPSDTSRSATSDPRHTAAAFAYPPSPTRYTQSTAALPAARGVTSSNSVRSPDPAKRVARTPGDDLRSAVNRDALRSEARKAAKRNLSALTRNASAPILAAAAPPITPPTSPDMKPSNHSAAFRADPRPIAMHRNPSMDSTVSSASTASSRVAPAPAPAAHTIPESPRADDVPSLIADAGSPEAAILKLLKERNKANADCVKLWAMVEKQRGFMLDLNTNLKKALKENERYRKQAREKLLQSESAPSLITANQQLHQLAQREDSRSPVVTEAALPVPPESSSDLSLESRELSDTSDLASLTPGRSDTPLDASNASFSTLPTTPQSTDSAHYVARDLGLAEVAAASARDNQMGKHSPATPPSVSQPAGNPYFTPASHRKTPSMSSTASMSTPTNSSTSTAKPLVSRKAPPAPLKLSSSKEAAAAAKVTNNIVDPSDSEYEEAPASARAEQSARGRRKTREEDDREREAVAKQDGEHRSLSKKDKKDKNREMAVVPVPAPQVTAPNARDLPHQMADIPVLTKTASQSSDAAPIIRQQVLASGPGAIPKSITAPSLLSPGLPMSPRPGDRPMNSPMPRPPNKTLNTLPMSPKSGVMGLPMSPRAPRQPIPMPPQSSLGLTSPHLSRAEGYQRMQPMTSTLTREVKSSPKGSPEQAHRLASPDGVPATPGEIYQGLVTEEYPDLLLPPNALPSIYIKTASSRMRPSRQSYLAPKTADENPVFTLAVYEHSEKRQLWRVEKTFASLAQLDEDIKITCRFRERLPDKILFNGHAPARIDARRSAIDTYLNRMLESVKDDRSGIVVCRFLSTDTIGSDGGDYFGGSVDLRPDTPLSKRPRREGYLTKRGKNFGGWKPRYFVLDGPVLKYYDAPGASQLGSIKLQNAQIGKQSNGAQAAQEDEDNQFRHAILILEPKKKDATTLVKHVLCAESDEERDIWVDALLQYVDYKEDPEEVAAKAVLAGRPEYGLPKSPRMQKSLNDLRPPSRGREVPEVKPDRLRAVGYDDTIAGEAPIMGPPSPRLGGVPSSSSSSSPQDGNFGPAISASETTIASHPNISGPTNLHVISNAGEWGNKAPPPTPHAKDKKRGIFAGLRGRSSSDLGTNDKVLPPGFSSHDQGGGRHVRAVFGAPLADAVEAARPVDVATELPAVVYRCLEYLLAHNAPAEEGIFRLSGSNTVIKGLKDRFNNEGDVNLLAEDKYYDIHAVASLLKLYFRELPTTILTRELHLEFLSSQEKHGRQKIILLNGLVHRLPRENRALLEALSSFLLAIVSNADVNKMNIRNVGIVFSPTLNVPAPLISSFVEDKAAVFGPPLDAAESPSSSGSSASTGLPTELRSPRKQMFSDLPTPAYNQTTFQPLGAFDHNDSGMIPVHPTYANYQVAPQGDGGFGSLNDALKSPTVYKVAATGVPSSRENKSRRRESAMFGFPMPAGMQKKSSMTQLREEDAN